MSSTTCTHSDELLTLGAMQLLSAEEQSKLDEQVSACPACRARFQQYRALAGFMPQLVQLETAPSAALKGQAPASANGKTAHPPARFGAGASAAGKDAESGDLSAPEQPIALSLPPRRATHRLVKIMSGLAAAILLLGLIGGFWLLLLSRAPKPPSTPTIAPPTQQTVATFNPCYYEIAKGVQVGGLPPCGLLVMDYAQTPSALEEIDPATGDLLTGLQPLQVGNALLASLSANRLTLALGILPNTATGPTFIQMVWLDTWKLGARLQLPISLTQNLQDLAMAPDGTGVYAVIDDTSSTTTRAILQYYAYDRGHDTLRFRWSAPLPFVPGDGNLDEGSFALSADGTTAYIFSAATTTPQLAAIPLKANGLGNPRLLFLPSIASDTIPPFGDENYTYKPGDPIYQWYQPAVVFAPQHNTLFLVHAEASNPGIDVLTLIDLTTLRWRDITVHNAGHALADTNLPGQNSGLSSSTTPAPGTLSAPGSRPLAVPPQRALRPDKGRPFNGRTEVGAVSPDGRWLYLSGSSYAPQFNTSGAWTGEQQTGLGLLKIDAQTGQVVGSWSAGVSYWLLTFSQDGQSLYLFGPPPGNNTSGVSYILLVFDTQQQKLVSAFSSIEASSFILPLP